MNNANEFFATAKPMRLFLRVALPGLISMLAMSLYQALEGAFVGHLLGETALAAVNIAMPIVFINFAIADMIGVGSSVLISIALGKKDEKSASNIFTCALIMIVLAGFVMGGIIFFAAPLFTKLMSAEGELAALAIRYVRIYALLSPVTTIVFATDNYLRISGFVKGSMFLNIAMSAMTVGFLALYLVVFDMNVEGSALATCTSLFIAAIIAISPFVAKKSVLKFVKPKFSFSMIRRVATCGLPIFLNNIAGRVTAILMNAALLSRGGETAVAAYSVLMYAGAVIEPMLYGMSDSVQPAIGYNWGAKSLDRVRDITKCMLLVCGMVSILCTAAMFFFPETLAKIFIDSSKDAELMTLSVHAMKVFSVAFLVGWFGFAIQGFFGAIEKPLPATVLSLARALVFPVILIYALQFMGLDGLWLNYAGTALLTAILAIALLLKTQKHMKTDILQTKKAEQE